jgi:drug/metabolite transporter (DMT)-like permease
VSHSAQRSSRVFIAFACVYILWGSTYLAMRFGVEVLSPWVIGSVRFLIAGPLLLAVCSARGLKLGQSARSFAILAAIGILMLGLGNMAVLWAEQYLPSGFTALLIAVIPIYVALMEAVLPDGERLRGRGWIGIGVGFFGLIVLLSPGLRESLHGHTAQLAGSLVAVGGAFAWSCGSLLSRRSRLATSPLVAAGWEITFAGIFNTGLLALSGDGHDVHWTRQAVLATAWLVVFGSLVGYTAYIYLLEHVPVAKVATYAYVNPMIAVVLGAIFLGERLAGIEYVGMAAILLAVYLVTSSHMHPTTSVEALAMEAPPQS